MQNKISNLFNKLAAAEQQFFSGEILSPVYKCPILVKIEGVITTLKTDRDGWGVFTTADGKNATFKREPTIRERDSYLSLFPQLSFMVVALGDVLQGIQVSNSNITLNGITPIFLPDTVEQFDVIFCRFTGRQLWFESINRRYPRRIISELKDALEKNVVPKNVSVSGISEKERTAYQILYNNKVKGLMENDEFRFKDAVYRGGGEFLSYRKQGESYRVSYSVDGERYTSTFDKNMMTQSAGICLNGTDGRYDVQSLIGVIREGQDNGLIYRFD